ncbi:tyrosine-type recombinase/integrase [Rhodospira trueperi]|uniref:Site-specific recombinase XerD n=1 Tax=Rhodospira trueperi TaxID=69960 RepID=A0A1G7I8Q7_9PROT|nr:site-specific integrase [Rhodospira trueperi]SDF09072.1 Site-specific recombinase XerD [Rhodospira trueperi]
MSDIRKRDGNKGVTYQVRYSSAGTKTGYAYKTFRTMKEARAFRESVGAMPKGFVADIVDVPAAVTTWLNTCEKIGRDGRETVEPETLKEYRRRARVMTDYDWSKPLQDLMPKDVIQFRDWLLENQTRDMARRTLSSFHSVLIEMKHRGELRHDPAVGISIKSGGRHEEHEGEVQIPTDDEMKLILQAADRLSTKDPFLARCWARSRTMIYLAAFTGMRPSEYRGLTWANVLEDRVQVRQRADISGRLGPVKSRAARRDIFVPQFVLDMLAEWRTKCPASEDDLVFPTDSGKPILAANFFKGAWRPLMREAGMMVRTQGGKEDTRYTLYCLRHYFASKLIEKGRDLKFIQTVMGHSRIEITLNVYGHLIRGKEDEYKNIAEEMFSEIVQN